AATMLAVNQAKAYAADVGLDATTRALQMAGGRGILKELPLERWHRDALAGPVMPPSNDRCLETAGKLLCGLRAATLEFQGDSDPAGTCWANDGLTDARGPRRRSARSARAPAGR